MENRIISSQTAANVVEIMRLALEINPVQTEKDKTGNTPTVIVHFGGHVAGLGVSIYPQGWYYGCLDYDWRSFQLDDDTAESKTAEIVEILKNLLEEKNHAK